MEKKTRKSFIWLAILLLGTIWILAQRNKQVPYNSINGLVFGTVYNITYQYDGNLKTEIDAELKRFDGSLSPSMTRLLLPVSTVTKKLQRIVSSKPVSTDPWKSQPKPKELSILQ